MGPGAAADESADKNNVLEAAGADGVTGAKVIDSQPEPKSEPEVEPKPAAEAKEEPRKASRWTSWWRGSGGAK